MSTEATQAAAPAGVAATTPAVVQTPATTVTDPAEVRLTSDALKARLDEASGAAVRKVLKELGVEKIDDAKGAIARLKEKETAELTETQRYKAQLDELAPKAKLAEERSARLTSVIETHAKAQFEALPEVFQKTVAKIAGDDATARLEAINALREGGALEAFTKQASTNAADTAAAQAKAIADASAAKKPATTSAIPGPTPPKTPGTVSAYEEHQQLLAQGRKLQAANFAARNSKAIAASKPTQ